MWLSLRSRIILLLCGMVIITVGGGAVSIWHMFMMEKFFTDVLEVQVPALQAALELKSQLVMQKGYVAYFFQDKDPRWLTELTERHREFEEWLKKARRWAETNSARAILNEIEASYIRYSHERDKVIALYKKGDGPEGFELQKQIRGNFFKLIDLCTQFQDVHESRMEQSRRMSREQVRSVTELALAALVVASVLGSVLAYTLLRQVLGPIRQLALGPASVETVGMSDEIKVLGERLHNLMKDVEQTRGKLEWSREHLLQAEKWALVGKLAAGVAHSVRNPLTSVKMRLFSLERHLPMDPDLKEDFEVIAEEIRHIDTIVNNFLEFSRPPKLKMQMASPSDVVDLAIQLLRHRLESYNVHVEVRREKRLPYITADPDQLKEVLVNLMINACEAMVDDGSIVIEEEEGVTENLGKVIVIKVTDNGPGVQQSIQSKLFQPFFSTKEEGTGLGLSIATRIVEEHGGWIDLKSEPGTGAAFIITLPAREERLGDHPDNR